MKSAAVRAIRTFLQSLAGTLVAFPTVGALTDIRVQGPLFLTAIYVAAFAGLVSFLQNAAESLTESNIPKG